MKKRGYFFLTARKLFCFILILSTNIDLGQEPTEAELELMVRQADADGNGIIDFPEFLTMMARKMAAQDPDREINEAWEVFSTGLEFVPEFMIKKIMTNLGEELSDAALKDLVQEADLDGDGKIGYDDFYQTMKKDPSSQSAAD